MWKLEKTTLIRKATSTEISESRVGEGNPPSAVGWASALRCVVVMILEWKREELMQDDSGDNDAVFHPELGVSRSVALGNGVIGSLNIYVNANPFSEFYTHLVIHSPCAASPVGNSPREV